MGLFMSPYYILPGAFSGIPGMLGSAMPYPSCHGFPFHPTAGHRAPSPSVVTEEDVQKMIQVHRKRRLANEVIITLSYWNCVFCYNDPYRYHYHTALSPSSPLQPAPPPPSKKKEQKKSNNNNL